MKILAWAAPFLVLAGCAAIAWSLGRDQPSRDRVRLTWRQRAAWWRSVILYRFDSRGAGREIAAMEADIDRLGQQLLKHLGLEEGDT